MVQLALGLRERGHRVELACAAAPAGEEGRGVVVEATRSGLEPLLRIAPGRGVRPLADRAEVGRLGRVLVEGGYDLVHTWHTRDHTLALRAAGAFAARRRIRIVRSWRKWEAPPATPWLRWLFGPGTDGLLCVSPGSALAARPLRSGRPIAGCFGAVDLERFRPQAPDPAIRRALGIPADALVVGLVARVQSHRRFDLLLAAAARLVAKEPRARLLIVGRGTHRERVAAIPARELGISDRVVFAGHRGADYAAVLGAIDVFTFLVPGSDGTCRALLEACACAIPSVVSGRGALPEIVRDGVTGLVVEETPEALADAWSALVAEPERRRALGAAARKRAEAEFTPARLASVAEALYREALERSG
jgi:glycosyltransferase involved in cell wall biosynthesis